MSELKARFIADTYLDYFETGKNDLAQVYLKSEADKVIAEKDAEIARLKDIRKVHVEAIESMEAGLLQDDDEIRHQKYKRCLKIAKLCELERIEATDYTIEKWDFYNKWYNRWLKIAENFKEAK